MFRSLRLFAPLAIVAVGLATGAAPVSAAQDRSVSTFQDVVGACGEGDLLIADFTIRQQTATYRGRDQLHLRLTGSITRTGTGTVGRYAETQLDKFGTDGSETYSGVLSHLVVPGSGVYRAAGHAEFTADGDARFTPGLSSLTDGDFESTVCALLG